MKIAIVPFHSGLANDILFDKDNESTNSDDLITPYYYIKQEYEKRGVSINNSSLKFEIMAKQLYVASQRVL